MPLICGEKKWTPLSRLDPSLTCEGSWGSWGQGTHMQMKAFQPMNSAFLCFPREVSKTELTVSCEQVSQAAVDGLQV